MTIVTDYIYSNRTVTDLQVKCCYRNNAPPELLQNCTPAQPPEPRLWPGHQRNRCLGLWEWLQVEGAEWIHLFPSPTIIISISVTLSVHSSTGFIRKDTGRGDDTLARRKPCPYQRQNLDQKKEKCDIILKRFLHNYSLSLPPSLPPSLPLSLLSLFT